MEPLSSEQINRLLESAEQGALVYLIGAGGCGMSGLGHLLLDLGFRVAGSDQVSNHDTEGLCTRGARIHTGHEASQILTEIPYLVAFSSAIRSDNPELMAAIQSGFILTKRAVLLAALANFRKTICVAGMHGKTTTSALLAFALEQLGAAPNYAVGAAIPQLGVHARLHENDTQQDASAGFAPKAPWFVIETDESDGTLLEFHPEHALLLNVDEEHLDFFRDFQAVCCEFQDFASQVRGLVIFCADDPQLFEFLSQQPRSISYGFQPKSDYQITSIENRAADLTLPFSERMGSRFEVWKEGKRLGIFNISLIGDKNVSNAAAVIAMLHQLGFDAGRIASAIAPFRGTSRRQEELFCGQSFRVFDDYGHHPTEISSTLKAMKTLGCRRLLVAFQPHRYTRTQNLLREFTTCFQEADQLWLTEVYAASEDAIRGINGQTLASAIVANGQKTEYVPAVGLLPAIIRPAMRPGDLVLFLGAGDITESAHQLARELQAEEPPAKEQVYRELSARLSASSLIRLDEPLAKRTTLRVGGPADVLVEPASEQELAETLRVCSARRIKATILGRGSNLIIRDRGIRGLVISLAHPAFSKIEVSGDRLYCGAGSKLKAVAVEARRHGLSGLEFLEGIPGSVGGAMRMNAGAMGSCMFDVLDTVRYMDSSGRVWERKASEIEVSYRRCALFHENIALASTLKGKPEGKPAIEERMKTFNQKRWGSQPAAPSAGCIFKNPANLPAGKLIEELGLKGMRIGGAAVSEVHANFIVNQHQATAEDVLRLIDAIKQKARESRGIQLETEVEILGE